LPSYPYFEFVDQAEAVLPVAQVGPALRGTSNCAFSQLLLREVGRWMLP
jgi:hypothetical protein